MKTDHARNEEFARRWLVMKRPGRILFATDFSGASQPAWQEAVALAKSSHSSLIIAHVLRVPFPSANGYLLPRTADELEAAVRRDAVQALQSLLKKTSRAGVRAEGLLLKGRPAEAVARAAKEKAADLLVVGTHGRTGLPRLLLGSVASRIIAAAPCPVLAVPRRRTSRVSR